MKGKQYFEEQIVRNRKEVESEKSVTTVARETEVAGQTIFRWRNKYSGISQAELRRLKELEKEHFWLSQATKFTPLCAQQT